MPRLGDFPRPDETFVVIHATPEMNAEATQLLSNAAYAWFDRDPARDAQATLLRAISTTVGALPEDVTVSEHFPEPFLIRFKYPHHRNAAVSRHDFPFEGLKVQVRPWRLEDNAEQVNMRQHVRLVIENVPMYAWNDVSAQQAIGYSCSLDYIEDACVERVYTKALCVWAWVESPALVPRVGWVTLPGPAAVQGVPERSHRGLQRRCIVHLDIVEDMSVEDTSMPGRGSWSWGYLDGERSMRDRTERIPVADDRRDRGRREDDDDDRDRRGRAASRGWREKLGRSLSRDTSQTYL
jgi:hypothetical protein